MPELPEVETIRQDLKKLVIGRTIKELLVIDKTVLRNQPKDYQQFFKGLKIKSVDRRAKLLLFHLSRRVSLAVHLKMTGQIVIKTKKGLASGGHPISGVTTVPNKFTRLVLSLSGGLNLYFNDVRKFGYWLFLSEGALSALLKKYGPEPLSKNFTLPILTDNLKKRSGSLLKAVLLDQSVIAGLGNIYVDESLFLSGVKPDRRVKSLTSLEIKKIYQSIKSVLKKAVKARGTSFSNYVDAIGRPGSYWSKRLVYGRAGQPCPNCSQLISKSRVAGRGTHWCSICQK
ncbi:DNA-formamidopyrimidine glycosylase [Patescibacteria group bacterium]|nr:DNA-formamidopyrimidine glycosylase [Patescibacteria group bacterium]